MFQIVWISCTWNKTNWNQLVEVKANCFLSNKRNSTVLLPCNLLPSWNAPPRTIFHFQQCLHTKKLTSEIVSTLDPISLGSNCREKLVSSGGGGTKIKHFKRNYFKWVHYYTLLVLTGGVATRPSRRPEWVLEVPRFCHHAESRDCSNRREWVEMSWVIDWSVRGNFSEWGSKLRQFWLLRHTSPSRC